MTQAASYGIQRLLEHSTFSDVVAQTKEALKREGFGVLAEIDLQKTLRSKLDVAIPEQIILAACNPTLAHQALESEPDIGLLLPCNVVVRQIESGRVLVSAIDPTALFRVVDNSDILPIAATVKSKLARALDSLSSPKAA